MIAHDSRYENDLNRNLKDCYGLYDNVLVLATEVKKVYMNEPLINSRTRISRLNYRVKMSIQEHYSSLTSVVFFPSDFFPVSSGYKSFVADHYPFLAATRCL